MQGFSYWGDGGESPPHPLADSLFIPLHQEKCPPIKFLSPKINKNFNAIT